MELTKYEHACMVLELADERLVIDPGIFSMPLGDLGDVVAVVITHEHGDHWTPEQVERILKRNPKATVYGPAGVAAAVAADAEAEFDVTVVKHGDAIEAGPFSLKFFGEKHAVIHSSVPVIDNVGVLVNDNLWYGGDSYTIPPVPVHTLAAPSGAPWLKVGEAMDYVLAVNPKRSFPVHEMTLSTAGKNMAYARIAWATEQGGGKPFVLDPGESIDL
jgi:L-ascorbate metabolism protein UlaG (beta-lactamase superfamily)